MAQKVVDTVYSSAAEGSEGNETVLYLLEQGVKLNDDQKNTLIKMELTLTDLMNIRIDSDLTMFNELCQALVLDIASKVKFRSAIINLHKKSGITKIDKYMMTKDVTIALIGNPGAGKSSILSRFVDDRFDAQRITTVGVEAREKTINILDMKTRLRLLDTAGQEKFGTIANWYYRVSHAFIIVYDITDRKSFQDLKRWIQRLNEKASDLAVRFVVGTKVDLAKHKRKVTSDEGETFANQMGYRFLEVSAKSGRNINQMFTTVSLYVLQSKVIDEYEQRRVKSVIKPGDASGSVHDLQKYVRRFDPKYRASPRIPELAIPGRDLSDLEGFAPPKRKCC